MCGIFGFFGSPARMPSERNASAALGTLAHRGPDAHGLLRVPDRGLVLGHARLSVIDPAARSDQPFEASDCALVFNGEIYNYRQLRSELQALGAQFVTSGDTEVIAVGFQYWGTRIFERLRGMYAFALYDRRERVLHLARDEFGIKPLCFLRGPDEVVFASEVKAIAALRSLSVDGGVLVDTLTWGFQMTNTSLYSGVNYLEPGGVMTFGLDSSGRLQQVQSEVWSVRSTYRALGPEPSTEGLRSTIEDSVADHMIADVPVAVALSGGLDSSIVAAAAARNHPGLQAFTVTLAPERDAEVEHAALLCKHLGLTHRVARLSPCSMDGWLRRVAWHLEEPVANVNALLSYGLGAVVRAHGFKVVLVGEGADELFAGYPWYRYALDPSLTAQKGGVFDAYHRRRAQVGSARFLRAPALGLLSQRLAAQREEFERSITEFAGLNGFLCFDQQTQLQYSQLLRVDRMYMAHGIEARVPFLYRSVAQASAAIPAERKLPAAMGSSRSEKLALADAFAGAIPDRIRVRPKFGAQGTVDIWGSWMAEALSSEFDRCMTSAELRGARQLLEQFIDWTAVVQGALSTKEKFGLSLLLESVDCLMLSREYPDSASPVQWEILE